VLCSNSILKNWGVNCQRQASIGCAEGQDEIYWFDSCGNRENIYSSDKDASWNNGTILGKNESCNPSSSNADSATCGNCNYLLASKCSAIGLGEKKVNDGNFICRDMSCIDENEKIRQNGESWCVYDGFIGDGKDTVGSRHWKRMCINGEIESEPCADYRGEICVQDEINSTNSKIDVASCVVNDALTCIMKYNGKTPNMTACQNNEQCMIKKINVDKGFKFDMCVGKYPKGFDLITGVGNAGKNSDLCSMASQKCTVIYEKKISGWKCVFNCKCETKKFTEQMNDLCVSLGDCGSYVNYVGDGTDNIQVKNAPKISWTDYIKYATPVEGQHATSGALAEAIAALSGGNVNSGKYTPQGNAMSMVGTVMGGLGTVATAAAVVISGKGTISMTWIAIKAAIIHQDISLATYAAGSNVVPSSIAILQGFGTILGSAAIGAMIGSFIAKAFGLTGQGAMIITAAGTIAGASMGGIIGIHAGLFNSVLGLSASTLFIIFIIAIIIIITTIILGIGKTKKVIVKFDCLPWQPPTGAQNCDKCNGDPLKPCSEYRCSSLGAGCTLINTDSTNPTCVATENDGTPPIISPGEISAGYKFINQTTNGIAIRTEDDKCIPEFTPVAYSLTTNEYAQCKIDILNNLTYDEMGQYFAEETIYTKNHTNVFVAPSLASIAAENNITLSGDIIEKFANMNMYVRCQDSYGNYNKNEYVLNFCIRTGPDTTPAVIQDTDPKNGATLAYGINETDTIFYLNEPAECKYDSSENKAYSEMSNTMNCSTDLEDIEINGWPCRTTLTGLNSEENKIYVKCKDQPWLPAENDSQRNINTKDYVYTLYSSKSKLQIDSVSPNGIIEKGFEPVSLTLDVKTSGGSNDGVSACSYSFLGYNNDMILFYNTYSNEHEQTFDTLMGGDYNIYLKCEDDSGNIALGNATFSLKIDDTSPVVVRAYNEGSQLKILTDEQAACYYDLNSCDFNLENGTQMTTGYSTEHSADWNPSYTYHIKCKDIWGNKPDECSIIVKPAP